jgi:hypothetical protein
MLKPLPPAQEFFSLIFYLEKVMALEENGGAFEFVEAPGPRVWRLALRSQ